MPLFPSPCFTLKDLDVTGSVQELVKIMLSGYSSEDDNSEVVSAPLENEIPLDPSHIPKKLWKHSSIEVCSAQEAKNEAKVLVLYTGGTIGMMRNDKGALIPMANAMERIIRKAIHMHDEKYAASRFGAGNTLKAPLVLPSLGPDKKRVLYTIYEYEPLLDSSNMTMDDWINIAKDIRRSYELFDGFVVLHGTDTLSYTASALSFMLENLGKSVIITGSQIPIFEPRSDGRDNFLSALIIAGLYCLPEVCVFFNNKLFRGNRTTKRSNGSLDAFDSPNLAPLATAGIEIHVDYRSIFRPVTIEKFRVHSVLNRNVGLLRLFPSITTQTVRAFLRPPMQGVVLQTYGSGNIPSNRQDLLEELLNATKAGVIIVNITQCCHGSVSALYETGAALLEAGVIPGSDMTPEAALTKLSYVLSKDSWDVETKREMMMTNLRGELTMQRKAQTKDLDLLEAIARSLHVSSAEEMDQLRDALFPSIMCAAAKRGDIHKLESLLEYGANLSGGDYDGRTPLHVAASDGRLPVVEYLLKNGASVHMKDYEDRTPLIAAVYGDHHQVIELLVQCGAHLTLCPRTLGEMMCSAAAAGSTKRLQSLYLAGADLNQPDTSGRTALHFAVINEQHHVLDFLLSRDVEQSRDGLGLAPVDYVQKMGKQNLVDKLQGIGIVQPKNEPHKIFKGVLFD